MDFEFDPKDLVYVRIDRRRKLPASILLRALGYSQKKCLDMFFDTSNFEMKGDKLVLELVPERLRGDIATFDIKDNEGNVLLKKVVVLLHVTFVSLKKQCYSLEVPEEYLLLVVLLRKTYIDEQQVNCCLNVTLKLLREVEIKPSWLKQRISNFIYQ